MSDNALTQLDLSSSPNIGSIYFQNNEALSAIYVNEKVNIENQTNAGGGRISLDKGGSDLLQYKQ